MFNFIKQYFNFIFNFIKQYFNFIKTRAYFTVFFSVSLLGACSQDEFKSKWELGEIPEIITIKATPYDVKPDDTVTLETEVFWQENPTLSYLWLRCIPETGVYGLDCVSSSLKNTDKLPSDCTSDSTETCVLGKDATAVFTVPQIQSLPSEQPFFYTELVVSDSENIETACFDAIKNNTSNEHCLLGIKRIVYTPSPYKMQNPLISQVTIDGSDIDDISSLTTDATYYLQLSTDASSLEYLLFSDEDEYFLKVEWFTNCGTMEGVADDTDPLNMSPYVSALKCEINKENQTVSCLNAENILKTKDFEDSCILYIVLNNKIGGIDVKKYVFSK